MHYVIAATSYDPENLRKCNRIVDRVDSPVELGDDYQRDRDAGAGQQVSLGSVIHPTDERGFITVESVETLNSEQCVLLGAADDHPRDDVQHTERVIGCRDVRLNLTSRHRMCLGTFRHEILQ